jgi:hypothetical protein
MSVLVFSRSFPVPTAVWIALALVLAGLTLALLYALNEDFSFGRFFGKPHERFWASVSVLAVGWFVWAAFDPFAPGSVFGMRYWPVRLGQSDLPVRIFMMALCGSVAFTVASGAGLAGGYWGWRPVIGPGFGRVVGLGAFAGAGVGVFGVYANRALFLSEALGRIGYADAGSLLLFGLPVLFAACAFLIVVPPATDWIVDRWQVFALGAGLATLWVVPVELGEGYLRLEWNYGPVSLAEAAGLPPATEAPKAGTLVLSDRDGMPGRQYSETVLASQGLSLSLESLRRLEAFLEETGYRTLFLAEALAALRRGWFLHWRADRHLEATELYNGTRFPPDYAAFLAAIRSAPASEANRARLDRVSALAEKAGFRQVKRAQKMFEGFSAAYARFGDLEMSNAWLDRIRGLWPLFEDNIHIEPIEENFDGWIGGRLLYKGRPASGIRVGLFILPSTTTVIGAHEGLVASVNPDASGDFAFDELTSGRYYLALRADPIVLGDARLEVANAPGVVELRYGEMTQSLIPIEIGRGVAGLRKPLPKKPPAKTDLKTLPGLGVRTP